MDKPDDQIIHELRVELIKCQALMEALLAGKHIKLAMHFLVKKQVNDAKKKLLETEKPLPPAA